LKINLKQLFCTV